MSFCLRLFLALVAVTIGLIAHAFLTMSSPQPRPRLDTNFHWGPESARKLKADTTITPFQVEYDQSAIDRLHADLSRDIPLVSALEDARFEYGVNAETLREMIRYWRDEYLPRWPERLAYLNKYPQFRTQIQGLNLHFLHVKPKLTTGKRVVPLLLLHGWPGSVREFYELIEMLTVPDSRKGDFVYEIVVPSLPGYGWSQAASKRGLGPAEVSIVMRNLMLRLGHRRFVVQGGDWGAIIGAAMTATAPDNMLAFHSNMCYCHISLWTMAKGWMSSWFPSAFVPEGFVHYVYPQWQWIEFWAIEGGYMLLQATKPDTIGAVLTDNPVGLLAYISEKFSTWTDSTNRQRTDGGWSKWRPEFREAIFDNLMIYHLSNSITSSFRLYYEALTERHRSLQLDDVPSDVPYGCVHFRYELAHIADWQTAHKFRNLSHSTYHTIGGHFPALEIAPVLYEDFVNFTRSVL